MLHGRFEKANKFEWSRHHWMGLVVNVLKSKALEVCVKSLGDYKEFKTTTLKVYELPPKAYRLHFRGARKRPTDNYADCASYLEKNGEEVSVK